MPTERLTKSLNLKDRLKTPRQSTSKIDKAILAAYLKCQGEFSNLNTQQLWELMKLFQAYMKARERG